jgi:hypothetical protein
MEVPVIVSVHEILSLQSGQEEFLNPDSFCKIILNFLDIYMQM